MIKKAMAFSMFSKLFNKKYSSSAKVVAGLHFVKYSLNS